MGIWDVDGFMAVCPLHMLYEWVAYHQLLRDEELMADMEARALEGLARRQGRR